MLGRCGIDIRGRSRKLYLNYRTTDEIRKVAVALLEGRDIDDLDGGRDDNHRYKSLSHGPVPEVISAGSSAEAVAVTVDRVAAWSVPDEAGSLPSICIMTPSKALRENVSAALGSRRIRASVIESETVDTADSGAVRIATMHRAKDLEFDRVVVLALPGRHRAEAFEQLVYVSLTRARSMAVMIR